MRCYKNLHVKCRFEDQIDRCINTATEYASITGAKNAARRRGGYAVRIYRDKKSGDMLYYKIFA